MKIGHGRDLNLVAVGVLFLFYFVLFIDLSISLIFFQMSE